MSNDWWNDAPLSTAAKDSWWSQAPVAGAPAAAPQEEQPAAPRNYALGEVPAQTASNFVSSLGGQLKQMVEGVGHAVQHPIDTAANLGKLATTTSPFVAPLLSIAAGIAPKLPEEQQVMLEGVLADLKKPQSALTEDLAKAYGGWEEIKRTAAEDPARLLMDAATVATGGELALARAPGLAGKIGQVSGKVAGVLDPVNVATKAVSRVAEPAVRSVLGTRTGAGGASLAEAAGTGFRGGEDALNFRRAVNEGVPIEEVVGAAQQGVQNIKQKAQQVYQVRKNDPKYGWGNDPATLNFQPVRDAWDDLVSSYTTKSGQRKVGDAEWNQIQKVGDVVSEWEKNPALRTADDFDGLKQRIRAIYPEGEAPQLRRAVTRMANAVGSEIKKQVPGYHRAMKDYSEAADNLWEIERAFSLGDKASMQTAMSKLQSVMRNNASTNYGLRGQKLAEIEEAGGKNIRPYLAGATLSSWEPRSLARALPNVAAPGILGTVLGGPVGGAMGAALGYAGSSPRAMGELYHGFGRLAGAPDRLAERLIPEAYRPGAGFAYRPFGREGRLGARALDQTQPDEPAMAKGGYFRSCR